MGAGGRVRRRLTKTQRWLLDTYPEAFRPLARRPFKLGIKQDILAHPKLPSNVSKESLRKALASWTSHDAYLLAVAASGAQRIDLDGQEVGPVSGAHRKKAYQMLAKHQAARRAGIEAGREWRRWEREARGAPEAVVIRTRRPDDWKPPLRRVY